MTSAARFDQITDGHRSETNLMDGFWAAEPYVGEHDTWTYPELRLVLDHYTIRTGSRTREFWNWMHCLTPDQVSAEIQAAGSSTPTFFGDVTGADYLPSLPVFATLARR